MRNLFFTVCVMLFFSGVVAEAQIAPTWTRDITSPDAGFLLPVKTLHDDSNHVVVLSRYQKAVPPGNIIYKIYLRKYDAAGGVIWTLVYDHGGTGDPSGYDMVMDHSGNCYIAGGLMSSGNIRPILIKVDAAGAIAWERDSTTTFNTTGFDQVFYNNSRLYVKAALGIAKFDTDGNELWSQGIPAGRMIVDHAGQSIVQVYFGNPTNLFRYDSTGVQNLTDTTIYVERMAVDANNNFYLISGSFPFYYLVKYNSNGNFEWENDSLPCTAAFGDIGYEIVCDFNNDLVLVGLADTMYKLSPSGHMIWKKSMNGLDSYMISAKIGYNNIILVAGSVPDAVGLNLKVAAYDLHGNENWSGIYNGQLAATEFGVDVTFDNSGVYAIENNNNNTTLAKFETPFQSDIDFSLICVDSVWADPVNPAFVNVRIFNGNFPHLNHPSVMGVSSTGDTTINRLNWVNFFAHLGNDYQTYHDSITVPGVTDFSGYTFLISDGFIDTTVVIGWCDGVTQGIISVPEMEIRIYPNPVQDVLVIECNGNNTGNSVIQIFNSIGAIVLESKLSPGIANRIAVSGFADGIYFGRIMDGIRGGTFKFVKQ